MRFLVCPILLIALISFGCKSVEGTNPAVTDASRTNEAVSRKQCVNLNTATAKELEKLPGIGEAMAHKIIQQREQNGPFRRPEEIIVIEGFSERKYRQIESQVCAY